jgi:hypothetical protein
MLEAEGFAHCCSNAVPDAGFESEQHHIVMHHCQTHEQSLLNRWHNHANSMQIQ